MNRAWVCLIAIVLPTLASAETIAIVGGKIHTVGPQGTLENATIVIAEGKIALIATAGSRFHLPDDAIRIDASDKIITPGLFSPLGRLGLVEVSSSAGPIDSAQRGPLFAAGFDVADAYNPASTLIAVNRIEGITRAAIVPSPGGTDEYGNVGHVLPGLAAIVNLGDSDALDRRAAAMVVVLGEHGSALAAGSRTAAWLILRNALDEAADYRDHKADYERGMRRDYAHSLVDLEALQAVIEGDTPLLVDINRASDIRNLIELVAHYDLRAIIDGGAEAWMLADELAAADIAVILSVTNNLPSSFDRLNARRGAANILSAAGVRIALSDSQSQTHNARNITQSAGNAVADGLDWDTALHAITLGPAEIYGVADAVGSIEVGKAADIVIWPGDPFELSNFPDQVLINGVVISMQSRQTLLRDRYLNPDPKVPPSYRN
jgi:imidazolonepropionase-like amidohydrolase